MQGCDKVPQEPWAEAEEDATTAGEQRIAATIAATSVPARTIPTLPPFTGQFDHATRGGASREPPDRGFCAFFGE